MKTFLIIVLVLGVFAAFSYWNYRRGMVSGITAVERIDDLKAMILYYPVFCISEDAHKKFAKPVFIVHGDKDAMVDVSYGKRAAEAYPNAEFEILPGEIHGFYGKGKIKAAESSYRFLEKYR